LLKDDVDVEKKGPCGTSPLHGAAEGGHAEIVLLLLQKGANMTSITEDGETPLLLAARWGHNTTVQLLLDKGADVNVTKHDG
ncbi:ankyrin repeat-containing domain protein, partial [Baffinella frigidus]